MSPGGGRRIGAWDQAARVAGRRPVARPRSTHHDVVIGVYTPAVSKTEVAAHCPQQVALPGPRASFRVLQALLLHPLSAQFPPFPATVLLTKRRRRPCVSLPKVALPQDLALVHNGGIRRRDRWQALRVHSLGCPRAQRASRLGHPCRRSLLPHRWRRRRRGLGHADSCSHRCGLAHARSCLCFLWLRCSQGLLYKRLKGPPSRRPHLGVRTVHRGVPGSAHFLLCRVWAVGLLLLLLVAGRVYRLVAIAVITVFLGL